VFLTTAFFNLFVDECPGFFDGIELVMFGGERVSPEHVRAFRNSYPATHLLHVYGPVESSIFATVYQVPSIVEGDVPIGTPVANTGVLLTAYDRDPRGGQIVLTGDGLATGYIGDPEQTAKAFVAGTLASGERERRYLTGDLATLAAGDGLVFRGRTDAQLKIHGIRVEPQEVRSFAEDMAEVARAVVVGVPVNAHPKTGTVLFYSLRRGRTLSRDDMRRRIADHFPSAHVPLAVVQVDDVPLGESGKSSAREFEQALDQLLIAPVATRDLQDRALLEKQLARLANNDG
jgi:acyl-coenzyme A synthetase/AMP-(fatty) acid ligase